MTRKSLTPKQEAFVNEHIINGGNATQAAKVAGYKGNLKQLAVIGNENLIKPNIIKALESHREELKNKSVASFAQKQRRLWEVAEQADMFDKPSAIISAIAELNKMDGDHAAERRHIKIEEPEKLIIELIR